MAIVTTVEKVIRETADQFVNEVSGQFHGAIRAIYRVKRQIPDHVGTCTLLKLGDDHLLLTAAHVADHNQEGTLYVGGEKNLVPIEEQFLATPAPSGMREDDHLDFAACKLTPKMLDALGGVRYITSEFIAEHRHPPSANRLYLCLGYPNSRNKDVHAGTRSVKTLLWKYSSYAVVPPSVEGIPVSDLYNLFIDFNKKHVRDAAGRVTNAIWPRGASGGPVFDIGDFASPATILPGAQCKPRLAGIIIEKPAKANALVATRIGRILQAWRRAEGINRLLY